MKEKQELKKQLIILSIVLIVVIIVAIAINTINRDNESYTKIKDKTTSQNSTTGEQPSVDDFMDRLKGLVEENTTGEKKDNTITYENTDIVQLESGEIVLYNENEQEGLEIEENTENGEN